MWLLPLLHRAAHIYNACRRMPACLCLLLSLDWVAQTSIARSHLRDWLEVLLFPILMLPKPLLYTVWVICACRLLPGSPAALLVLVPWIVLLSVRSPRGVPARRSLAY